MWASLARSISQWIYCHGPNFEQGKAWMANVVNAPRLLIHPAQWRKVSAKPLAGYRTEVAAFIRWWQSQSELNLDIAEELDEALCTYHATFRLSKARSLSLQAGVHLALPGMRRRLPWMKMVCEELVGYAVASHSLAMPEAAMLILSVAISQGYSQMIGALLRVQHSRGLRPAEVLTVMPEAILLPEETLYQVGMICIGYKARTKVGRPQYVLFQPSKMPVETALLRWMKNSTSPGTTCSTGLSVPSYSRVISKYCKILQLPHYTAHGARAGFVSDQALRGETAEKIMSVTRHASLQSLRVYMDVVSHMRQVHEGPLKRWLSVAQLIQQYPQKFYPQLSNGPVLNPFTLL